MTRLYLPEGRIALVADVHGHLRALREALAQCRDSGVEAVALLGDLFDRADEAAACVEAFEGWRVLGVLGNHEREALQATELGPEVAAFLRHLHERLELEDVVFAHDDPGPAIDTVAGFFRRWEASPSGLAHPLIEDAVDTPATAVEPPAPAASRLTFVGHTHLRSARDDRGPISVERRRLPLRPERRYVINPGALVGGQFAVWDRATDTVEFRQVGRRH